MEAGASKAVLMASGHPTPEPILRRMLVVFDAAGSTPAARFAHQEGCLARFTL